MNSLEIIKQELIKQKNFLETKGFEVPVTNRNPSPTDISNAISNINVRFADTTATESDVRVGKTFISQTQGIKTGTLDTSNIDVFQNITNTLISAQGEGLDLTKVIPQNITRIRPYAFWADTTVNMKVIYATDFTIPSNIQSIGTYSFYKASITGKLTIPKTCTSVGNYSFGYTPIIEVLINSPLTSDASYLFTYCEKLKKATLGPEIMYTPSYCFYYCRALEEIVIQSQNVSWSNIVLYGQNTLKRIIFEIPNPITAKANAFQNTKTAQLIVPYEYFEAYFNATNYQQYSNPMCGYGDFLAGKVLPTTSGIYNLVWYASVADLQAQTNPVTYCESDGRYYSIHTEIETA